MTHIPIRSSNYRATFFEQVQVIYRPFHHTKLNWNWILHFVVHASCYDSWWMTNLTHNSFPCIYFNSLRVSSNLVLIIRRINCTNTTSGICHSVSVTVSCAGRKGTDSFRPAHETVTDTEWQIPEVVLILLILRMMSTRLLETCRELK